MALSFFMKLKEIEKLEIEKLEIENRAFLVIEKRTFNYCWRYLFSIK